MSARDAVLLALLLVFPCRVVAQTPPDTAEHPISLWASVTLGPTQGDQNLIGGQLALWWSRDQWVAVVRRSGGSDLDTRDVYDTGFLIGRRTAPSYALIAGAIGPTVVTNAPANGPNSNEIGIGFTGSMTFNVQYVGLGLTAFGAAGPRHRFVGFGLTAEVGKIR